MRLYAQNDLVQFYVFIHKMETGTPDGKAGSFLFILQKGHWEWLVELLEDLRLRLVDGMEEEIPDAPGSSQDVPTVNFYLTSVYDHSVYEAFSRTVQRLLPCQGALERLMDLVCQVSISQHLQLAYNLNVLTELLIRESIPLSFTNKIVHRNRLVTSGFQDTWNLLGFCWSVRRLWRFVCSRRCRTFRRRITKWYIRQRSQE